VKADCINEIGTDSMSRRVVYFNGRFVPEEEARVSIYDSALIVGDMAYEVTRTIGHQPFRLEQHIARLRHSMNAMQIDPGMSDHKLTHCTLETLNRNLPTEADDVEWNIIHNISRGPAGAFREAFSADQRHSTVSISCFPLAQRQAALAPAYHAGLDLVVPEQRSIPSHLLDPTIKTRSRWHFQLANLQAAAKCPGSTAVLVDPDGFLTEGTSGNVFLVHAGRLLTPTTRNLLPGITRGLIIELARHINLPAAETDINLAEAARADEMFMTSTSIGILHARSFEGEPIRDGKLGPFTARLRQALREEIGLDFVAEAERYAVRIRG
jgi:branched-chain amino acid aminotransferase